MSLHKPAYDIIEHVHRLAAWAASRAAGTVKGMRFEVQQGKTILESAGMRKVLAAGKNALPTHAAAMDAAHREWRTKVIHHASTMSLGFEFTHGLAAKLINIYLKVAFVTLDNATHSQVGLLHPPIDRELLTGLAALAKSENEAEAARSWRAFRDDAWSSFDSATYEAVIAAIRSELAGQPMWKVESAWQGFQGKAGVSKKKQATKAKP